MARIRTIKPEFWTAEQVMECSPIARLLFIGMWNFCDDGGNHPASCKTLKAEVFPGDDLTTLAIAELIRELIDNALVAEYESGGKRYWHVTGWHHQKIEKPNSKHPKPPSGELPRPVAEHSPTNDRPVAEDSATDRRPIADHSTPEGKGREKEGTGGEKEGKGEEGGTAAAAAIPSRARAAAAAVSPVRSPEIPGKEIAEPASAESCTEPSIESNPELIAHPIAVSPPTDPIAVRAIELTGLMRRPGVRLQASDPRVRQWAANGVSDAQALLALGTAQQRRTARANPQPVNAGLLDAILADGHPPRAGPRAPGQAFGQRTEHRNWHALTGWAPSEPTEEAG
jgi:hypothetical protein